MKTAKFKIGDEVLLRHDIKSFTYGTNDYMRVAQLNDEIFIVYEIRRDYNVVFRLLKKGGIRGIHRTVWVSGEEIVSYYNLIWASEEEENKLWNRKTPQKFKTMFTKLVIWLKS